ncbi:MAG: hypothetical protein EOP42_29665 [Sphingobacteriaceae bacterium]|nr:MAG: hypothetical protein EOP42_29665 [Sphingobacteriaceae bacterium]
MLVLSHCHAELVEALLPSFFFVHYFVLEQKKPKIQECRITSGRHSAQSACVAICLGDDHFGGYRLGIARSALCHAEPVEVFSQNIF